MLFQTNFFFRKNLMIKILLLIFQAQISGTSAVPEEPLDSADPDGEADADACFLSAI